MDELLQSFESKDAIKIPKNGEVRAMKGKTRHYRRYFLFFVHLLLFILFRFATHNAEKIMKLFFV